MIIVSLDISTQTGFAIFDGQKYVKSGTIFLDGPTTSEIKSKPYPLSYVERSRAVADVIVDLVSQANPDIVVIEETNKAKARYTQKLLEFIHLQVLQRLYSLLPNCKVVYLNTSSWRKTLNIKVSKEDRKNNAKVNEAKRKKQSKKELGLKGKITTKHLSVRFVNQTLGLNLKMKDNNEADALALALAYLMGASLVSGV
jgi:Holliday junction resolvasome RuvABC endonuclease subunit